MSSTSAVTTVKADLPAEFPEIFNVQTNVPLIHQVVVAQLAAARQGTHSTKTRGEVRGGGAKPYRQKGTGRARQGSTRAPQFTGGGVVHGPTPRDYSQRTPKKMKAAALRGALSDRARHDRVHVIDALVSGAVPSAKQAWAGLSELTSRPNLLLVLERGDEVSWKSARNLEGVHVLAADQLNTYDVLCADDVVFTQGAFDAFVTAATATRKPGTVATPADQPVDAPSDQRVAVADATDGGYGPDSAAALEDGSAPAGFDIKGNADSMKYHQPGGQWYDATIAEVWFRTADAAEAAGFTEAGHTQDSEDGK
ncbi:MAG TPA: 50S ribosomal protein L4 [Lapillicoccus sp.]|jgi:large subunit ribosomal protein L4|uniref:50S ribosomal protein L4, sunset domain variant n=1 Tax=Lapillicoccus sp. TaxID=1909287 RepID=UPI002F93D6FE